MIKRISPEEQLKALEELRNPDIPWRTSGNPGPDPVDPAKPVGHALNPKQYIPEGLEPLPKTLRKHSYYLFWDALKRGIIKRATDCEHCGGKTNGRELDGHHDDYYQPLDVIWLCRRCHKKHHDKVGAKQLIPRF